MLPSNLKQPISWSEPRLIQDIFDFGRLCTFQVSREASVFEISANTTLELTPDGTGVLHLFAQETLEECT